MAARVLGSTAGRGKTAKAFPSFADTYERAEEIPPENGSRKKARAKTENPTPFWLLVFAWPGDYCQNQVVGFLLESLPSNSSFPVFTRTSTVQCLV